MGNSNRHKSNKVRVVFSEDEKHEIGRLFHKLSSRKQSVSTNTERLIRQFHKENLQMHTQKMLTSSMSLRLYNMMKNRAVDKHINCSGITSDVFAESAAVLLKGTLDEKASCLCQMISESRSDNFTLSQLMTFSVEALKSYALLMENMPSMTSEPWNLTSLDKDGMSRFADHIIHDMSSYDGKQRGDFESMPFSETQLEKWLYQNTLYQRVLNDLFSTCFKHMPFNDELKILMPKCGKKMKWNSLLLNIASVIALNDAIPQALRCEWRPLYSLHEHGESFSTMLRSIVDAGPTIIIIRDKKGHVFGGFNSQSWKMNPQYYGSSQCFLFTLRPSLRIYHSTNFNDNFVYLDQGQVTLPNGLGFGGQFDYFGLFIDCDFGTGKSCARPTCTTYGSPRLCAENIGEDGEDGKFEIDALEVYAVGKMPEKSESEEAVSILDKDVEAKVLLELAGKVVHSEGLREKDPMALE